MAAVAEIRFHTLVLADGDTQSITTDALFREGDSVGRKASARIGASAAGGAIIGAIFGGEKGAAIGAAAGAGAGTRGDRGPEAERGALPRRIGRDRSARGAGLDHAAAVTLQQAPTRCPRLTLEPDLSRSSFATRGRAPSYSDHAIRDPSSCAVLRPPERARERASDAHPVHGRHLRRGHVGQQVRLRAVFGFGGNVGFDIDFGYAPNFFGGDDEFADSTAS